MTFLVPFRKIVAQDGSVRLFAALDTELVAATALDLAGAAFGDCNLGAVHARAPASKLVEVHERPKLVLIVFLEAVRNDICVFFLGDALLAVRAGAVRVNADRPVLQLVQEVTLPAILAELVVARHAVHFAGFIVIIAANAAKGLIDAVRALLNFWTLHSCEDPRLGQGALAVIHVRVYEPLLVPLELPHHARGSFSRHIQHFCNFRHTGVHLRRM